MISLCSHWSKTLYYNLFYKDFIDVNDNFLDISLPAKNIF